MISRSSTRMVIPASSGPAMPSGELGRLPAENALRTGGDARQRQGRRRPQLASHDRYPLSESLSAQAVLGRDGPGSFEDRRQRAQFSRHREGLLGPGHESTQRPCRG